MPNTSTLEQYRAVQESCATLFRKKTEDYGTAWRVLRPISIVDQIYIKAQRIRTIQEKGVQRIGDSIRDEFTGIINYSLIGLMQLEVEDSEGDDLPMERTMQLYHRFFGEAQQLMEKKNHDYGEAWRQMSGESFADLILMKLHRMRQILANGGKTQVSEGLDANYHDMINYSVFALILMGEAQPAS